MTAGWRRFLPWRWFLDRIDRAVLARLGEGKLTGDLVVELGWDWPTVKASLRRLEERGLVRSVRDDDGCSRLWYRQDVG